jgi:two-component system response regulator CpxR
MTSPRRMRASSTIPDARVDSLLRKQLPYGKIPGTVSTATVAINRPILIVDDDPDIRDVLAEALVDVGFEVVTAVHGRDALRLLERMVVPPAAILLDLMMPVMDGYAFLEERTKDKALASIPLAIVTAGYGVDQRRIGGGTPIVRKPFDLALLVRVLRFLQAEGQRPA